MLTTCSEHAASKATTNVHWPRPVLILSERMIGVQCTDAFFVGWDWVIVWLAL